MKQEKKPWFIWLSFLGLMFLNERYMARYMTGKARHEDQVFNKHLGYAGRFFGLFLGMFFIPVLLMLHFIMDRMPEPWYTVWNCIVLAYAYFAGVFITWRLWRYLNRG